MSYWPTIYEPKTQTQTVTRNVDTAHTDYIDWDFDFDDPRHLSCRCCDDSQKQKERETQKARLKLCEDNTGKCKMYNEFWSNCIVTRVGMCSRWPWWQPRPYIFIVGKNIVGNEESEWIDWLNIKKITLLEEAPK